MPLRYVEMGQSDYVMPYPGGRLDVGPRGHLYEQVGLGQEGETSLLTVGRMIGSGAAAYHGYRRNNSIGWAVAWGVLGGLSPFITNGVALAQGFGKRK